VRDAARRDPEALLGGNDPLTLDEIQREPGLLTAVKRAIDCDRRPGRYLLAASANLLLMRQVSESLAGRASYLTLWPMTRREQLGLARAGRWDDLLATPDAQWRDLLATGDDPGRAPHPTTSPTIDLR
jgi:predicted AAA+ superfamily ATPase